MTHLGATAFSRCDKLTEIELPESLTSIGLQAFALTSSLEELTIPAGVTEFGPNQSCTRGQIVTFLCRAQKN